MMRLMINDHGAPGLSQTESLSVRTGERRTREGAAARSHRDVSRGAPSCS